MALFDVRPVDRTGNLDLKKINRVRRILNLRRDKAKKPGNGIEITVQKEPVFPLTTAADFWEIPVQKKKIFLVSERENGLPTREELLSDLEKLDKFDNLSELDESLRADDFLTENQDEKVFGSSTEEKSVQKKKPPVVFSEKPLKKERAAKIVAKKAVEKKKEKRDNFSSDLAAAPVGRKIEEEGKNHGLKELEAIYLSEDFGRAPFFSPIEKPAGKGIKPDEQLKELWRQQEPAQPPRQSLFMSLFGFLVAGLLISLIVPGAAWFSQGLVIKDDVLSSGFSAAQNLLNAGDFIKEADWQGAEKSFSLAHRNFLAAEQELNKLGKLTVAILENLPGDSLISSGSRLVKVGERLSMAGENLSAAIGLFSFDDLFGLANFSGFSPDNPVAPAPNNYLTDLIGASQNKLNDALIDVVAADEDLRRVEVESLPLALREQAVSLKEKMPVVKTMLAKAAEYSANLLEILGHRNPRQYLLIFQNNGEARATGGFIGTYGLISFYRGQIKNLFIDGVFNPDGQLREKIVPPQPIQKISTAWSMHDANWFADFPDSARKVAWFYEKTGGPTVDGVISFTPTVIERLLEITGPIALPQYDAVLETKNFVELIQYKVEADFDKELNQPKQILADFAPVFLKTLTQLPALKQKEAMEVIFNGLAEKHILIYFADQNLENFIKEEGWAGELIAADKDYLSAVSSNINGFKTDRMIEETISHQAEIKEDGSIIDTVEIIRKHLGGRTDYDWWNRVNANYFRLYVPLGSELLSVEGQTFEDCRPPIDYQKSGFKTDPLVESIENKMVIDKKTNTRISSENGKTVFGNWTYVSPGETVALTYRYRLPFKIDLTKAADSYSLLVQKQSGSLGSKFSQFLKYPVDWKISWQYPNLKIQAGRTEYGGDLKTDKFLGVTFGF